MKNIIFDCERMKYPHTGIYYYCLNLGKQLLRHADGNQEAISLFIPKTMHDRFRHDAHAGFIQQRSIKKFWLPSLDKYHIWHATYQNTEYLPERNRRIKVVLTIHDLNFMYDEHKPRFKKEKHLRRLQHNINRADAIICISDYCRQDVMLHCETGNKPVHVIHNGTNELPEPALSSNAYKPGKKFLFSVGVVNRKKNLHALLPLLQQNNIEWLVAGRDDDNDYRDYVISQARALGVGDRFHLLGTVSEQEKSWYYHNCYAFATASLAEGFCLPVAEAMSAGKPLFLSPRTALPEIGGSVAFYFPSFHPGQMQHTFLQGMHLYEGNNMQQQIRERAAGFSWEKAAESYLQVYRSLIG